MLAENLTTIIEPANGKNGLRIRQKVYKDGFREFLDTGHITLEEFGYGNLTFSTKNIDTLKKSIEINVEFIPILINALKSFTETKKKKKLVSVQLVTDMNQYKKEK